MRNALMVLSALVLAGCARDNEPPRSDSGAADSPAAAGTPAALQATAPATVPAALTLADFAGRWTIHFVSDASDSVLATYELNATGDSAAWTLQPPGSEPVPVGTAVAGDSLLFDAGTYKTPSVEMTTHGVGRLDGGRLTGWFESRYAKAMGDSVIRGRLRGTRRP